MSVLTVPRPKLPAVPDMLRHAPSIGVLALIVGLFASVGTGLNAGGSPASMKEAAAALEVTPAGEEACRRYAQIREQLLVKSVRATGADPARLSEIAAAMRSLSGQYDQAARAAASL